MSRLPSEMGSRLRTGEGRRRLDDYETPEHVTEALLRHVSYSGAVLEPCAGTGRIVRVLRRRGLEVEAQDIKDGQDFLERTEPADNVVTNPPYHRDMPFRMLLHAFSLVGPRGGKVSLLVKPGFLFSSGRKAWMQENPPASVVVMSDRIKFLFPDGTPIAGQFFDHCWLTWDLSPDWLGTQRIAFE